MPIRVGIDGDAVTFSAVPTPGEVPWAEHGVDIVLECTGKFRTPETLDGYFAAGVKKVIVAAPVKSGSFARAEPTPAGLARTPSSFSATSTTGPLNRTAVGIWSVQDTPGAYSAARSHRMVSRTQHSWAGWGGRASFASCFATR
jgi:hypothetical protein